MDKPMVEEGFDELRKHGWSTEHIRIDHNDPEKSVITPTFTAEDFEKFGASKCGEKLRYLGEHGYQGEREWMEKLGINKGDVLTVKSFELGNWRSHYVFEEIPGTHNSVMFEKVVDKST